MATNLRRCVQAVPNVGRVSTGRYSPLILTCIKSYICSLVVGAVIINHKGEPIRHLRRRADRCIRTSTRSFVVHSVRRRLGRRRRKICQEKEGTQSISPTGGRSVASCEETANFRTLVKRLCLANRCRQLARLMDVKLRDVRGRVGRGKTRRTKG